MTTEEKILLLQDISARLPFGIKAMYDYKIVDITKIDMELETVFYRQDATHYGWISVELIKPLLRDMNNMSKYEWEEYEDICDACRGEEMYELLNFLHEHHVAYRTHLGDDMFQLSLAWKVPEDNNPYND